MFNFYVCLAGRDMITDAGRNTTCRRNLKPFEVLYLYLTGQGKYSYQILTKQPRCWRVVKIGHQDLILTTSLKASGRFETKGEIRPNEVRKVEI